MSTPSENRQPSSSSPYQPSLPVVIMIVVAFVLTAFVVENAATSSVASSGHHSGTHAHGSGGSTTTTVAVRIPVSQVVVQVANGTSIHLFAKAFSQNLQTLGWGTLAPLNGPHVAATVVYYKAGFAWAATEIAGQLHVPTTALRPLGHAQPVPGASGDDIVVVLGTDAH